MIVFFYNFSSGFDFAYVSVELMSRSQVKKWNRRFVLRADWIGRELLFINQNVTRNTDIVCLLKSCLHHLAVTHW